MAGMAAISAKYMASSRLFMRRRLSFGNSTTRFVLQRQLLISDMIFVAYELNLPLNMEKPHYRSQRAGEWSLIWAHDSRPIYRLYRGTIAWTPPTAIYIGLTLYYVIVIRMMLLASARFWHNWGPMIFAPGKAVLTNVNYQK